ncbi:MAG: thioredoxin family protein [Candidatus Omnitrophota bacterium]|jgi:small redox-active disulfide protein 2|nr:MAG: thioredoxin family protein [Candidatus Omnitrophota bacterium]
MKKIQILGTGCPKCQKLTEQAKQAASQMGIAFELEKVTEIGEIMKFGVMTTPALVIDGAVKTMGKIPAVEEIKHMLQ